MKRNKRRHLPTLDNGPASQSYWKARHQGFVSDEEIADGVARTKAKIKVSLISSPPAPPVPLPDPDGLYYLFKRNKRLI